MYYYATAFVCEYLCIPYFNSMTKLFAVAQLAPIINLLQAIVFWLSVGYSLLVCLPLGLSLVRRFSVLILSGQAKYFFIPFKGTSKPNKPKQTY